MGEKGPATKLDVLGRYVKYAIVNNGLLSAMHFVAACLFYCETNDSEAV